MRSAIRWAYAAMWVVVLSPAICSAQSSTTGAIAGVVRDTTGAVLPGVTVEAASPALIEKVRVAVTDNQGNYKIVELRPGTYLVSFTLPGFSTFKREGIELTTGFTATANAEMRVGALEETVTVTGASPIVDVQNVRTQRVLSREILDALPTGKATSGLLALTLGATLQPGPAGGGSQDVGGNKAESAMFISIHGARANDLKRNVDGMNINATYSAMGGPIVTHRVNAVGMQETILETNSGAESETGGGQLNYVPRDGGNTVSVYGTTIYTNDKLQGDNVSEALRQRGLTQAPTAKKVWDHGIGVGGPIKKDRLWFYSSNRWWGAQEYQPGAYFNATQGTMRYTPDLSRPAYVDQWQRDFGVRLTWQVSEKNKVTISDNLNQTCQCYQMVNSLTAPEATGGSGTRGAGGHLFQATWSYPATNRVLFQAGASVLHQPYGVVPADGVTPESIAIQELSTGLRYNAKATSLGATDYGDEGNRSDNVNQRVSASYVTGSHAVKAGLVTLQGIQDMNRYINQSIAYSFRLGVPVSLTQWASPVVYRVRLRNIGVFAQDQWTVRRLTLNYGVRFDHFDGRALGEDAPATRFLPARRFEEVRNIPRFNDVSPRFGAAYDLFGNGKTAVRLSFGRYVGTLGAGIVEANHPALAIVTNASRTWNDANGNFVPDCVLTDFTANGECGAISNSAFGTRQVNRRYADNTISGFGNREYNWQTSAVLQHELLPGFAASIGYFRTTYGNFTVIDNLAVTPADYSPFCLTVPTDSRLGAVSGTQACGLYNIIPSKFGQVNELVAKASDYPGARSEVFNGVDVAISARFGAGGMLTGGLSLAHQQSINCVVVDSPEADRPGFCDLRPPWAALSQFKLNGMYPGPWGVQISAVLQNLAGSPQSANVVATNAQVQGSLGRNLAGCPATGTCTATVSVPVLPLFTQFEDRLSQFDLRLAKVFKVRSARLKGMFDIYNLFNAGTIQGVNPTYGAAWLRPTAMLGPRLFKFGGELNF